MKIVRGIGTHTHSKSINNSYELLLLALSSYILRTKLPQEAFHGSHNLVLEPGEGQQVKTHALIHSYTLSKDIRRRKQVYRDTQSFARLLREKDTFLAQKEKSRKQNLDIDSIHRDCQSEIQRWERNWTSIKGEWILDHVRSTLSPIPPTDFFSQSYTEAFDNYSPDKIRLPTNIIQHASHASQNNISHLHAMEKSLNEEIKRLESEVAPATPPRRTSVRKSMPPTTLAPPSPGNAIQFRRTMSRLGRSVSEEIGRASCRERV